MDDPAIPIVGRRLRLPFRPMRNISSASRNPVVFLFAALLAVAWGLPLPWMAFGANPASKQETAPQQDSLAAPPPRGFDQPQVLRRCLVFTVKSVRDRQADVEHEDWVVLTLDNRCGTAIFNLQVELVLVDTRGRPYGKTFWVVAQGERLDVGARWEDTVSVPDPDNRVPRAWTMRVLRAEMLSKSGGRAAPPPKDWR